MEYRQYVKSYDNFPKEGVVFWDFSYLLRDPHALSCAIQDILNHISKEQITKIAAIEAKGFTIGSILSYELKKPLYLIRKPNLIPGEVDSEKFVKEYGFGEYQVKKDSFDRNDKVLIVYDIFAGSGASKAAINLVEKSNAKVAGCVYVIELEYLKGREELGGYDLFSLVKIKEKKND